MLKKLLFFTMALSTPKKKQASQKFRLGFPPSDFHHRQRQAQLFEASEGRWQQLREVGVDILFGEGRGQNKKQMQGTKTHYFAKTLVQEHLVPQKKKTHRFAVQRLLSVGVTVISWGLRLQKMLLNTVLGPVW